MNTWINNTDISWKPLFEDNKDLLDRLWKETRTPPRQPEDEVVFRIFQRPLAEQKVVILGQDPYPTPGVPCGRAFAVTPSTKTPASLKNIFKELDADIGFGKRDVTLESWALQGVFLMNTSFTVLEGQPGFDSKLGWDIFTRNTLSFALSHSPDLLFVCWGAHAKKVVDTLSVEPANCFFSAHPSPLAARRGFFGSHPFSWVNKRLQAVGKAPIEW